MKCPLFILVFLVHPRLLFSDNVLVPQILDIFDWTSMPKNLQLVICTNYQDFDLHLKKEIHNGGHNFAPTMAVHQNKTIWKEVQMSSTIIFLPQDSKESTELITELLQSLQREEVKTVGSPIIFVWPEHEDINMGNNSQIFLSNLQNLVRSSGNNDTQRNFGDQLHDSLQLRVDLDLYLLFFNGDSKLSFKIFELYSIKNLDFFKEINFFTNVLKWDTLMEKLKRRENFNKTTITAVAQDDPVIARFEVLFNKSHQFQDGFAVKIYWNLRDMLNFTENVEIGSSLTVINESVSGLSYDLIKNKTGDISVSHATITSTRAATLSFLQPTASGNGVHVFFKQPPLNKMRNIFVAPFNSNLWITIMGTWTAIIIVMIFLSRMSNLSEDDNSFTSDAVMWAVGAMCQKGWPVHPHCQSMRIVFFCGCLSGLIIYVAYSASIVSVLSVKHLPIKKFFDLILYNFVFYVHEKSATLKDFLRDDVIQNPKYNLTQDILTTDTVHEVDIMLESANAFLSFPDVFYTAAISLNKTDRFICETLSSFMVNSYRGAGSGMFLDKGSPFFETFNHKIMIMKERGLIKRYMRIYEDKTTANCGMMNTVKTLTLTNSDLFIAFLIILTGLITAFLVFLSEKVIKKYRGVFGIASSLFYRQSSNASHQ